MDRPDPEPDRRPRARRRRRDLPDLRRAARTCSSFAAAHPPLHGHDPAHQRPRARRRRRRPRRGSTGWRGRCRWTRRGTAPEGAPSGTARRLGSWMRRNVVTQAARELLALGDRGASGRPSPRTSRCCTSSSTRTRAAALDRLFDTERRRSAGPLRRRLAARAARDGGGARASVSCSRRRCGGSSTADDRVRVVADGVGATRAAGDRRDPADARRADRLRPAAARPPRPADPADAAGHRGQVHGDLRRAVLARRRALRPGDERHGPVKVTYDNSPPGGSPGVLLGFLEGRRARELGRMSPASGASW